MPHVIAGCLLNPCAPGWQIDPPPITSTKGLIIAAVVACVCFAIGAGIGRR